MKYKIIVDKQSRVNPSSEKRTYEIDIEELRRKGSIADSFVFTRDEAYVMRRLSLSEYHVLSVLPEPVKETLEIENIELFEGDNYIYVIDMVGNRFYAEYLLKNEFNDIYPTKVEMFATIETLADMINLELQKKVDGENYTAAQLLLMLNEDESEAKLKADKINLNGLVTANETFKINLDGSLEAIGGTIGGWTISVNGLSNGTVSVNNDGSSTVYTVADLIIIRNYIMEKEGFELSPAMIEHYDLNKDGVVDARDYMQLQNLIGISMN